MLVAGLCAIGSRAGTPLQPSRRVLGPAEARVAADVIAGDPATAEAFTVTPSGHGVREVTADGTVTSTGDAAPITPTASPGATPAVAIAGTPSGAGYWVADLDGTVHPAGDAASLGSAPGPLHAPIVGMTATHDGRGYWLVATDGGVFAFGDARFAGSTGNIRLNSPIVGMAATPSGNGYWLVAADGGVFAFGDARFAGSTGNIRLNAPIVGMAATPSGNGYRLVAADGGVFTFGDARFVGSAAAQPGVAPVDATAATPDGAGYWEMSVDGRLAAFGDAAAMSGAGAAPAARYPLGSLTFDVTDPHRPTLARGGVPFHEGRDLPTLVVYPAALNGGPLPGPWPLVVFAHGYATTPDTYLPLLDAWASAGYVVAAPFLPGERGDIGAAPVHSDVANEPDDLSDVISAMLSPAAPAPLVGLADPTRVAVAGHSDGAMAVAALTLNSAHHDARIKAALILSGDTYNVAGGTYGTTPNIPVLIVQGTADPVNNPSSAYRLWAVARAPKALLWMLGAGHLPPLVTAGLQQDTVRAATTDFLDGELGPGDGGLARLARDGNAPGLTSLVPQLG